MPLCADQLDFRLLLESSVDGVMIHDPETFDVIWANRVAADVFGCSPTELSRMTYAQLAPRDPSYSREGSRVELARSMVTGHNTFEWRIRRATGEEFPIEASVTYVTWGGRGAIMVQFRDITDRKATELTLRRQELRFRELVQDLAEGVCIVGQDGRIEFLTPSASRLLGVEQGAAIGMPFPSMLDARTRRLLLAGFARATSQACSLRYRIRGGGGAWRWHEATYRSVVMNDETSSFVLHFRDITERMAEEKVAREKEKMLEYLARHNAMGEMAAAIAHELSQPLAAAQNYIEGGALRLAGDAGNREEVLQGLRHAAVQVERAADIVRSVRDYAVKHELTREVVDLNEIVSEVRYFVELRARPLSVRSTWQLAEQPLAIECERVLIGQVILNLAFNAIDELSQLRTVRRLMRISTTQDGGHALLRVEDRGRGLPAGRERRIFDGFHSTKKTGHGIGLSLCQNIVVKHGGVIWAEPARRLGSIFCVKLPLRPDTSVSP